MIRIPLLKVSSESLSAIGLEEPAESLKRKLIEEEAKRAFGEEVVWVRVSRGSIHRFFWACFELVPTSTTLTAVEIDKYWFEACVPISMKDSILRKSKWKRGDIVFAEIAPFVEKWKKSNL